MQPVLRPQTAVALGLVLAVVGGVLIQVWGGVGDVQSASSAAEFSDAAHSHGNQLRSASWADILLFVPGYVLLGAGLFALFYRASGAARWVRLTALVGVVAIVATALADETENFIVRAGLGDVDLDVVGPSRTVSPSEGLINALQVAYYTKTGLLALSLLVLVVLAAQSAPGLFARLRRGTP